MARVVIYTRSMCIWCLRAKVKLSWNGVEFEERDASSAETRAELLARTGRKTVPQIFVDGRSIGGFDELRALGRAGELRTQLGL